MRGIVMTVTDGRKGKGVTSAARCGETMVMYRNGSEGLDAPVATGGEQVRTCCKRYARCTPPLGKDPIVHDLSRRVVTT